MTSEMAMEDIEDIERKTGRRVPARDVILLNALGLKCDLSSGNAAYYEMPRAAFLGKLTFREPTIGHTIWIDTVAEYCLKTDLPTRLAIEAFALSRDLDALPDAIDRKASVKAIDAFTKKELAPFTFAQVHCSVLYAKYGNSAVAREYPLVKTDDEDAVRDDVPSSLGAGLIVETLAMGLGLSIRDASSLTISKARQIRDLGLMRLGVRLDKNRQTTALGNYYSTKNEIVRRLSGESGQEV